MKLTGQDVMRAYFKTSEGTLTPMTNERADAMAEALNTRPAGARQGEGLDALVREIIADVLCDTQGIQPRAIEHTQMVVGNRIEKWLAARAANAGESVRDADPHICPTCGNTCRITHTNPTCLAALASPAPTEEEDEPNGINEEPYG